MWPVWAQFAPRMVLPVHIVPHNFQRELGSDAPNLVPISFWGQYWNYDNVWLLCVYWFHLSRTRTSQIAHYLKMVGKLKCSWAATSVWWKAQSVEMLPLDKCNIINTWMTYWWISDGTNSFYIKYYEKIVKIAVMKVFFPFFLLQE